MGKQFKHRTLKPLPFRPTFNAKSPNGKSSVPAPTSRTVKAEGVESWGGGIGNNVNNIANGVNSTERGAIAKLDATLRRDRHKLDATLRRDRHKRRKVRRTQAQALVFHGPAQDFSKRHEGIKRIVPVSPVPHAYQSTWGSTTDAALVSFRSKYR
jgi:hypothetical protein